jgi:3-hydroxyisobutyrate dehydrogenase/2-hydroxy-3-oxopropionate reductase
MGGAMATTIRRSGFNLVLWNRDETKAKSLAGELEAEFAHSPKDAVASSDFVVSSLADDAAVKSVYLASDGVVSGVRPRTVVIDTSTIDPDTTLEVGDAVDAVGANFLDCPVSGSVAAVQAGTLTVMAGGDEEAIERARPVLDALASRVVPTGGRGTGSATKLAVNALVHGLNVALSESLVLAERAGIDRLIAYEVFASGAGGAPFVQYKRQAFENPEMAPIGFTLELVKKDLELITGLAARVRAPMAQAEVGLGLVERAIAAGFGDADLSALAVYLRSK